MRFLIFMAARFRIISRRRPSDAAASRPRMKATHVCHPAPTWPFFSRMSTRSTRARMDFRAVTKSFQPDMAPEVTRFRIFSAAFFSSARYRFFSTTISIHLSIDAAAAAIRRRPTTRRMKRTYSTTCIHRPQACVSSATRMRRARRRNTFSTSSRKIR